MENLKLEKLSHAVGLILENLPAIYEILKEQDRCSSLQDSDILMTRMETDEYLKIDPSTLWHWTKKGKIKCYGISNRRYYKISDIKEALVLIKQ
ncbi:MAG: helix-turn-helix domain-containing protein [Algicola sp.]|nr:helix-turn-helix domain-containing protein [Algicola sp.]